MKDFLKRLDDTLNRFFPIVEPDPEVLRSIEGVMAFHDQLSDEGKMKFRQIIRETLSSYGL